jgi:membrane-bound serine protease (ClpP class)
MHRAIRVFKLLIFGLLMMPMAMGPISSAVDASTSRIEVLRVEGTIVPVMSDYIIRGISEAEEAQATACIIEINTPGGLLTSTEKMVETIMNADVPVIAFVAPKGAWAASAGTFITLSAHIAAMTPGTTIGAAHPVSGGGEEISEDEMKKVTEFSAKWMKTIAQERGRNIEEAELAVTESKSFTDVDALELNLINIRADNLEDLTSKINGTKVTLASGKEVTIDTTSYGLKENEMNAIERFLLTISDPNIAYILMTLATIGLITEISNPGMIFPGVAGGISLLLSFYSLGVLDAYWGGVALILLGIGLLIAEIFTSSFGLLTGGGIVALVTGSLVLFSHSPGIEIDRGLIAGVTVGIAAFFIFAVGAIVRGQKRHKATGAEGMVGRAAIARTPLDPEGKVLAEGELWNAITGGERIEPREEVIITKVDELRLWVEKKSKENKGKGVD